MPAYLDSAYALAVTATDPSGTAINLTGYDLGMRWYRTEPSRSSPLVLTEGNGITVTDPTTGIFIIDLTPAQACQLGVGTSRVEIYKNYSNDTLRTMLLEGTEIVEGHRTDG